MQQKAEGGLQDIDNVAEIMVRYKAIVRSSTRNDELGQLI